MIESGNILQGRYRIEKQIGQGGMGAVYVATDERFGSTVAIKQTLCMDDNYRKALDREARLLNSLKHTALPRVSDHFLENDGQFLVMEFIPGEDLCCILEDQGKPFETEQVLKWADQLLDALDFLHNQNDPVIHRDIKPQNLKITPNSQIILLDFGLAKGNPTESNNKTAAKSIFGYSRNYASLEQIQGTGTDPRSDLYSLAATLYHLLTGDPPEDALTRAMNVLSQKVDPLKPSHLVNENVPKGVAAIIASAMDLNAEQRPSSAAEMRTMLAEHEKYARFATESFDTLVASPAVSIYAQPTKLMPAATAFDGRRMTEAKTVLLTGDDSQLTVAKADKDSSATRPVEASGSSSRFAFAASSLGILLLGTAIAGGVLLYSPDRVPAETLIESPAEPAKRADEAVVVEPSVVSDVNQSNGNVRTETARTEAIDDRPKSSLTDQRPVEKASTAQAPLSPNARVIQTEDGPIVIDGDQITMGNTRIVGNRVISPQGEFILKEPPIPPQMLQKDGRFPANLNNLTPEQRRRLIRAMRRYETNVQVKVPERPRVPQ